MRGVKQGTARGSDNCRHGGQKGASRVGLIKRVKFSAVRCNRISCDNLKPTRPTQSSQSPHPRFSYSYYNSQQHNIIHWAAELTVPPFVIKHRSQKTMSVSFVLVGSQTKRFKTVVKSLAGIGAFVCVSLFLAQQRIQTQLLLLCVPTPHRLRAAG